MADEFQTEICSGNWWNSGRNTLNGGVSLPCSTSINDMGISFGWPHSTEMAIEPSDSNHNNNNNDKGRSCDQESSSALSVSGSSIVLQDAQKSQGSDSVSGGGSSTVLMDSTLQMMGYALSSSTNMDWSQALLRSSGRTDQSNFHSMLQEDLNSRQNYQQDQARNIESVQGFALDHQHGSSSCESTVTCQGLPAATSFSLDSSSVPYGSYPSTLLQGLLLDQSDLQTPQAVNYPQISSSSSSSSTNYSMFMNEFSPSWSRFPQFLRTSSSPPKQQQIGNNNQLHFSNNTPYWNAPAASSTNGIRSSFYPSSSQPQLLSPSFEAAKVPNNLTLKPKAEVRDSNSLVKKSSGEPANKRARVDTPSPLPTFKVRKEKLGDRITALQQLVSPFGKTDTASVLFEAIEYIKFLHEQVSVLSAPYMKNGGANIQQQQQQQQQSSDKSKDGEGAQPDLRSRGLCLVPISSTFPVTNETTADFWTPTFGGTYR